LFAIRNCPARTTVAVSNDLAFHQELPPPTGDEASPPPLPWERIWGDHCLAVPTSYRFLTGFDGPRVKVVATPASHSRRQARDLGDLPFFANQSSVPRKQNAKLHFVVTSDKLRVAVTLLRDVKANEELLVEYGGTHGKNVKSDLRAATRRAQLLRVVKRAKRVTCSCGVPYAKVDHFRHHQVCTSSGRETKEVKEPMTSRKRSRGC